mgnify:CR=1 FL=1
MEWCLAGMVVVDALMDVVTDGRRQFCIMN